eukprot:351910-Chlamydomonas_euryale.AAC.2
MVGKWWDTTGVVGKWWRAGQSPMPSFSLACSHTRATAAVAGMLLRRASALDRLEGVLCFKSCPHARRTHTLPPKP